MRVIFALTQRYLTEGIALTGRKGQTMVQLMHSFEGERAPPSVLKLVERGEVAAFCLFRDKNVRSLAQLRELTDELRAAAVRGGQPTPLIGTDQESGQLQAVTHGATELPGMMALGATRSAELAKAAGRVLGTELLAMGVNLNFAPTVDVNINPNNPVIGIRAFGDDPALVADLGAAMIAGLQGTGVLATAKHFPGHGDTDADSHYRLPVVDVDRARLDAVELRPFRAAIAAGVAAILSAHVIYPALDDKHPATTSQRVLTGLLRDELGFTGIAITDAMDMHAVAQFGAAYGVRHAIEAGTDLVLLGHLPQQEPLTEQAKQWINPASVARIRAAQARVNIPLPDSNVIGSTAHQQVAQEIAEQSVTLLRDHRQLLPLQLAPDKTLGVVIVQPENLTAADTSATVKITLPDVLRQYHPRVVEHVLPHNATDSDIREALQAVANADTVIVGTIQARHDHAQAEFINALLRQHPRTVGVAMRMPDDLLAYPAVGTYLCTYSIRPASMAALGRVLFGELDAVGQLPIQMPGITSQA
ncbi:MAG: beta-N-acetylhexosaminidase [Chloroflexota bacterium]